MSSPGGSPGCVPRLPDTDLDDVIDVDLAVLVVVERLGDPLQLVFGNVLDLAHDGDQLVDADQVFPEGVEQTAYRKQRVTRWNGQEGTTCGDNVPRPAPRSRRSLTQVRI